MALEAWRRARVGRPSDAVVVAALRAWAGRLSSSGGLVGMHSEEDNKCVEQMGKKLAGAEVPGTESGSTGSTTIFRSGSRMINNTNTGRKLWDKSLDLRGETVELAGEKWR